MTPRTVRGGSYQAFPDDAAGPTRRRPSSRDANAVDPGDETLKQKPLRNLVKFRFTGRVIDAKRSLRRAQTSVTVNQLMDQASQALPKLETSEVDSRSALA